MALEDIDQIVAAAAAVAATVKGPKPRRALSTKPWRAKRHAQRRRIAPDGLSKHELYNTWHCIIQRCENPDNQHYYAYGARGIKVCERWHSLPDFLHDILQELGPRPPGLTLDRFPNRDGDYEPGNVRWATRLQQIQNRRPVDQWRLNPNQNPGLVVIALRHHVSAFISRCMHLAAHV